MKVSIPIESTLSVDSHRNDIKNPAVDRDLFNNNRAYLINSHLTNPKKKVKSKDSFITTRASLLNIKEGSVMTSIEHEGINIANVLSLGIENVSFHDRDDAVIHDGFLWLIRKTLNGYIVDQINLQTQETERLPEVLPPNGALYTFVDVRFIKNTHKVITRNSDGSINIIDETQQVNHRSSTPDPNNPGQMLWGSVNMEQYLSKTRGEFTAAEMPGGWIVFGYNNPKGVPTEETINTVNIAINSNMDNFDLRQWTNSNGIDLSIGQKFVITVANGVRIGSINTVTPAMNFVLIDNAQLHSVELNLGINTIISGRGGQGGLTTVTNGGRNLSASNGGLGGTAIWTNCDLVINGQQGSIIQAGGGGGAAVITGNNPLRPGDPVTSIRCAGGGGGAGIIPGFGGIASGGMQNVSGNPGTVSNGGQGGLINTGQAGVGGNPAQRGGEPIASLRQVASTPGNPQDALRIMGNAVFTRNGAVQIIGDINVIR